MVTAHHTAKARLEDEQGTIFKDAPDAVALIYPSPYAVAMSSLGYQTIYRRINAAEGKAAHRAFLPDRARDALNNAGGFYTYEGQRPVADYRVIAFSLAYETEIAGVIQCLQLAGISPLAEERGERDPFVLIGGPLTFSNPLPAAPYADAILMGEADETITPALDIVFNAASKAAAREALASAIDSAFIPALHDDIMPPVAQASDPALPAYSQITTPNTELRDMFLIEPERGCHRGCTYCVMRRSTNNGMRTFPMERVLSLIPNEARKVGLVGAATTDHPQIVDIVETLIDQGKRVSLSSLRADRLTDRFVGALARAGHRTLTTAADGASERLRAAIKRHSKTQPLITAAELAREHKMKRLKLYMMVGLPSETDADIDELIEFSTMLSTIIPLSLGIAAFVAKRNTPLDGEPFAGMTAVNARLSRLRKGVQGRVDLRATSARWAWVEYVLAQGGRAEGRAVLDAVNAGGGFQAWKQAFEALPSDRPKRMLVRPGHRLGRASLPVA